MPRSRLICHHATANVFRGKDALFIFLLTRRMRRRTEDILDRWRVVTYREGGGGSYREDDGVISGGITKRAQLRGEEQGFGADERADKWKQKS